MTISLNVLTHLGMGLYSNVAAVLSEVVANSWDADAENVCISIDTENKKIIIQDDGHGMTVEDANQKYLVVGLERRNTEEEALTPRFKRKVMGRKGIGKLSLFSIARTVEVHSRKNGEKHGFEMDSKEIKDQIKGGSETKYKPNEIAPERIDLDRGTRIILTNLKRQLQWSDKPLRRRLARRFSIVGSQYNFKIVLDGRPITIDDREYQDKIQYIWTFGDEGLQSRNAAKNIENCEKRSSEIDGHPEFTIDGWIGTAVNSKLLIDSDTKESINKIVVMVRGKLAQEDILEEFGEGGLYTKYVFGEIHADFLDMDDQEDIATTSRQRLIEEDPRYQALKEKLRAELKHIQNRWTRLRNEQGTKKALDYPQIKEWFKDLNPDHKIKAKKLFGRINHLTVEDEEQKRQLFISGVLAFESLKLRNLLHRLDEVSPKNLEALKEVFIQMDDLEASAYYQIVRDRMEVIRKLTGLVDEKARERALQEHLFKHLWLLDPSWERATHTERMERQIKTALQGVYDSLPEEQQKARLDIYYATTGNKHVIIELKRANRVLGTTEIYDQISRYNNEAKRILENTGRRNEPLEIVCVVGKKLREWVTYPNTEQEYRDSLRVRNARIVYYDELIENALQAYNDYVVSAEKAGRVYKLIQSIEEQDVEAISPTADQV